MPPTERVIHLSPGQGTEVRFKSSASGGYDWIVTVDNEAAISIYKKVEATPESSLPPGASNDEVFQITAVQKGVAVLHFKQQRAWEPEAWRKEEKIKIEIS